MSKQTMNMAKGIGTGLMAGMVVGYVGSQLSKNNQSLKKKTTKAINNMSDIFDNVQNMFK